MSPGPSDVDDPPPAPPADSTRNRACRGHHCAGPPAQPYPLPTVSNDASRCHGRRLARRAISHPTLSLATPATYGSSPPSPGLKAGAGPNNPRDSVESKLHVAVCSGKVQLAAVQNAIATDRTTALTSLGLRTGSRAPSRATLCTETALLSDCAGDGPEQHHATGRLPSP